MSRLELRIPIHISDRNGKTIEHIKKQLKKQFSKVEFDWRFYNEKAVFNSNITINRRDENWIVNTLLDNFFKGIFFKLSWC